MRFSPFPCLIRVNANSEEYVVSECSAGVMSIQNVLSFIYYEICVKGGVTLYFEKIENFRFIVYPDRKSSQDSKSAIRI